MSTIKLKCTDNGNDVFIVDSLSGIRIYNTTESLNYSTGSIITDGGITVNSTSSTALLIRGGAVFDGNMTIGGILTIEGGISSNTIGSSGALGEFSNIIIYNTTPFRGLYNILYSSIHVESDPVSKRIRHA